MVIYNCELCNYNTNNLYNYNKHIKSKKHKTLIKSFNESIRTQKNPTEPYKFRCPLCDNCYSTNSHMNRHLKKCKLSNNNNHNVNQELLELKLENQKLNYENKLDKLEIKHKEEMIKEKDKCIEYINNNNNTINNDNTINNNSHNTINNNITNNITLNFLNQNYSDVINMDDFKKLVDNNQMPKDIVEMIESAFNNDTLQVKSHSLIVYMKNVCKQNDKEMLPFICNDTNNRSYKEKTKDGWRIVKNNANIIYLIDSTFRNISFQYPNKTIIAEPQLRTEDLPKSIRQTLSTIDSIKVNVNRETNEDRLKRLKYYMEKLINFLKQKEDITLKTLISSIYIDNFLNIDSFYKVKEDDILTTEEFKEVLLYLSLRDVDNITIHKLADLFGYTQ